MANARAPQRKWNREPATFSVADSWTDLAPIAESLAARIKRIRKSEGAGVYVFAGRDGGIRIVKQGIISEAACRTYAAELIGLFGEDPLDGSRARLPTGPQLAERLRIHFVKIGFVSESEIMDHVLLGIE